MSEKIMRETTRIHALATDLANAMLDAEYNRAMACLATTTEAYQGFIGASVEADEVVRRLRNLMIEVAKVEGKSLANA